MRQSAIFILLSALPPKTHPELRQEGRKESYGTAPLPVGAGWMRWCVVCGIAVVIPTLLQARWGLGWVTLHWMSWTCPPPASCTHGHHGLGVSVVVQASRRCNIGWPIKYTFGDGCRFSCYYQEKCCKIDASVTHHLPLRAPWLAAGRKGKDIGTVHVHQHHRQKTQNDGPPVDEYTPQSGFHRSVAGRFSYIRQVTRFEPMICRDPAGELMKGGRHWGKGLGFCRLPPFCCGAQKHGKKYPTVPAMQQKLQDLIDYPHSASFVIQWLVASVVGEHHFHTSG